MPERLARDSARMLIGGHWRESADTLPLVNPSTGEEIGRIARGTPEDIDAAVAAAEAALEGAWGRLTAAGAACSSSPGRMGRRSVPPSQETAPVKRTVKNKFWRRAPRGKGLECPATCPQG